jgi:hypothetical protein
MHGIETQPFYPTRVKLVKSGSLLEIYVFGREIFLGGRPRKRNKLEDDVAPIKISINKASAEDILKASSRRAKKKIKRLIHANCFAWLKENGKYYKPVTLTLTFTENIQDLKTANYEFTKFIRRLNYEVNKIEGREAKAANLKYIGVFEIQKRGAIHYHLIFFNLPYINDIYNKLRDIWGLGRINVGGKKKSLISVNNQTQLKKIIDYFIKYIQKSVFDNNHKHQKKYIASKNLKQPVEQYSEDVVYLIQNSLYDDLMIYHYDGEEAVANGTAEPIPYIRHLNYLQYDLAKNQKLNSKIDKMLADYSFDTSSVIAPEKPTDDFDLATSTKTDIEYLFDAKTQPTLPDF